MGHTYQEKEKHIDWEAVFERMTGSEESAVARENIVRYLANSRDMSRNDGASIVSNASENGELLEIVVERYPHVDRRFYFVPRVRFEQADSVYIPFWGYLSEEVDFGSGEGIDCNRLLDRIVEHSDKEISDRTLSAIDDHLEELVPMCTSQQGLKARALKTGEATLYGDLIMNEM